MNDKSNQSGLASNRVGDLKVAMNKTKDFKPVKTSETGKEVNWIQRDFEDNKYLFNKGKKNIN